MKKKFNCILACMLSGIIALTQIPPFCVTAEASQTQEKTSFEKYGNLKIVTSKKNVQGKEITNRQICDKDGNPVQLKGMSTFGLQWEDGAWVLNDKAFDALAKDWKCDIIRLAMYVSEEGYKANPEEMLKKVEYGIKLATDRGMYVLIDWHILTPGDPMDEEYLSAGEDLEIYKEIKKVHPEYRGPQLFFAYISQKYGDQGNILFETSNEPNGLGTEENSSDIWKEKLLPYHQSVVNAIRAYDKDTNPNIVICGTDNWSQFVDAPILNPVKDIDNDNPQIMYTVHFYSGTHDTDVDENGKYWLGSKIENALDNGLAVFCTEWGTSEASGDGGPFIDYSQRWLNFMEEKKISWCSWSLAKKNEVSAAMLSTTASEPSDHNGDGIPEWSSDELSITGNFIRAMIRGEEAPMYEKSEIVMDFPDENVSVTILEDSPVQAADYKPEIKQINGNYMLYLPKTPDSTDNPWNGPRISLQDLGTVYSIYKDLKFDVYIDNTDALKDNKLEIQPVIQTEGRGWWSQLDAVTLTSSNFTQDKESKKLKATVKVGIGDAPANDKLGHITFIIGATNGIYIDNIGFESVYNGDILKAPLTPDEPGTFVSLPFTFENGQREGWKKEGDSKLDYTKISIDKIAEDNSAMSFPVKFEPGKNEWEDGARMTSPMNIFSYEDCQKYDALAMNVYLEQGKATNGKIQLELCSTPNGDGYWYQSGKFTLDPLTGEKVITPDGKQLQKYYVYIPLNNNPEEYGKYPFSENVEIRNIILALHNDNSDYEGLVYYDNIRYVDAQNLDGIDTVINKNYDDYFAGRGNNNSTVDKNNDLENGKEYELNNVIYKVINSSKNTSVEYVSSKKALKNITIEDTIVINGIKCKVTSIADNAFKNNKKINNLIIGKNVKSIGKKAFYNCKNLSSISINTINLTEKSIGKNAFGKLMKNIKIKVPSSKADSYKKILYKKGLSKKAIFKK